MVEFVTVFGLVFGEDHRVFELGVGEVSSGLFLVEVLEGVTASGHIPGAGDAQVLVDPVQ